MNYALIENNTVINIIYLHPMNADDFPNAVPINALPVKIGDAYVDGKFYSDGIEITESVPIDEQIVVDKILKEVTIE